MFVPSKKAAIELSYASSNWSFAQELYLQHAVMERMIGTKTVRMSTPSAILWLSYMTVMPSCDAFLE